MAERSLGYIGQERLFCRADIKKASSHAESYGVGARQNQQLMQKPWGFRRGWRGAGGTSRTLEHEIRARGLDYILNVRGAVGVS